MLDKMLRCSADQAKTLVAAYSHNQDWHAQTVIATVGALLGHAIQTSAYSMAAQGTGTVTEFERPTNPPFGKFINCTERIQIFIDNELTFLKTVGEHFGWFTPSAVPDMHEIVETFINQIGGDWFPRLSITAENMPREWSPDAVPRFAPQMRIHLNQHGLQHNVCEVLCLSLALCKLIAESQNRLDPSIALRIGLEMAVATANIGNLDRPHVATHVHDIDEHTFNPDKAELPDHDALPLAQEAHVGPQAVQKSANEIDVEELYPGVLAEILLNETNDMPILSENDSSPDNVDSTDDREMPMPRPSRLSGERSKFTAFGKRQTA